MSLSRALPSLPVKLALDQTHPHSASRRALPFSIELFPSRPQAIAVIGNHLPRQCGIATFTTDLCDALESTFGTSRVLAVPVTDPEFNYAYPPRVEFELQECDPASYLSARDFLNRLQADVVCLQHEYGIFGGTAGGNILRLLRGLEIPLVTTLHTVLRDPNHDQRRVMQEIAKLSSRLVVMSQHSSQLLQEVFDVSATKIDVIHHGVPDLPFSSSTEFKRELGLTAQTVLLSFGLLSPNKGIENIIAALPQIVSKNKDLVLLIVGATHPHLMRREGDSYRRHLEHLAHLFGVASHVKFHHEFVTPQDMARFIGAADIYITPYRHEAQASSGTLAYALGAGKAIISTPYWHAAELLGDGRGLLVPFGDPAAITAKVIELRDDPQLSFALRRRAYLYARTMVWKNVARQYMKSFQRARAQQPPLLPQGISMSPCETAG